MSTAEFSTRPAFSSRSSALSGCVHATATMPFFPGTHTMAETRLPLEYTRSVKDWCGVMDWLVPLSPGAESWVRITMSQTQISK